MPAIQKLLVPELARTGRSFGLTEASDKKRADAPALRVCTPSSSRLFKACTNSPEGQNPRKLPRRYDFLPSSLSLKARSSGTSGMLRDVDLARGRPVARQTWVESGRQVLEQGRTGVSQRCAGERVRTSEPAELELWWSCSTACKVDRGIHHVHLAQRCGHLVISFTHAASSGYVRVVGAFNLRGL